MRRYTWVLLLAIVPLLAAGCGREEGKNKNRDRDRPRTSDKSALLGMPLLPC